MAEKQKPQPDIVKLASQLLRDPKSVRLTNDDKQRLGARIMDDQRNDPQRHKPTAKKR
jgi:hypothetical protein